LPDRQIEVYAVNTEAEMKLLDYAIWAWIIFYCAYATVALGKISWMLFLARDELFDKDRPIWNQLVETGRRVKEEDGYIIIPFIF